MERLINSILDPDSKPNRAARYIIAFSVGLIAMLTLLHFVAGTY